MKMIMRNNKIFITMILFFILAIYFFIFQPIDLRADARQYYNIAQNIIKGNGYSISLTPPYLSALDIREPVYPFLIAFGLLIFNSLYTVVFVQLFMHILTAYFMYKIAQGLMKETYAFMVFSTVLLFPTLVNYSFCILTETTFLFFLALSIYLLYFGLKNKGLYLMLLFSGVSCGVAFLTKHLIAFFPFFFAVFYAIVFLIKSKNKPLNIVFLKKLSLFLISFSIVTISWFSYKSHVHQEKNDIKPIQEERGFYALIVKAELANSSNKDILVYGLSVFSEKLVNRFYPEYGEGVLTTANGFFYKRAYERYKADNNKNPIGMIYGILKSHPIKFLLTSFIELIDFNMFFQMPLLNSAVIFKNSAYISFLRAFLKILGLIILYFSIRGMIMAWKKGYGKILLPLIGIILYYNLIFVFIDAIPRYSMPLIPFYIMFCVIGIKQEIIFKGNG